MGLIASLFSSIYTYKIITLFTNRNKVLVTSSLVLVLYPFITGLSYINFSNTDIFSISLITILIYYTMLTIRIYCDIKPDFTVSISYKLYTLSLLLGSVIWLKKSSFIISISIFIYLIFVIFKFSRPKSINLFIFMCILFLFPSFLYNKTKLDNFFSIQNNSKIVEKDIIQKINYERNYYNSLLGEYHSNSTSFTQTILSIFAGPVFFILGNNTFHSISDFIAFTQVFKYLYTFLNINHTIFLAFITCIPLSIIFFVQIFKYRAKMNYILLFFIFITHFTIISLCLLSYENKAFNFLINKDFRYKLPLALLGQFAIIQILFISNFQRFKIILIYILLTYFLFIQLFLILFTTIIITKKTKALH